MFFFLSRVVFFFFFFFFSSRRRHTRLVSDWSSDCALPISDPIRGVDRQLAAVQALLLVGEDVEDAVVGIAMEREQRRPPPLPEVLCLVHDDRVVPRPEPNRRLGERL